MTFKHRPASYYTALIKNLPAQEGIENISRIKSCQHFTRECECEFGRCKFPWRVRKVGMADCLDCLNIDTVTAKEGATS